MSENLKTIKELADELGVSKRVIQYQIDFLPTENQQKNSIGAIVLNHEEQDFIRDRIENKKYNKKDISGQKFGKLTAKKRTSKTKGGCYIWECECDCGEKREVPLDYLTKRNVKSCGCLRTPDFTGKKVGRLLVKGIHSKGKSTLWECKCDCGNLTLATTSNLKKQKKRSCGCLEEENRKRIAGNNFINISGQKFGKLLVIKKAKKRNKKGEILWECKCDCGGYTLVCKNDLKTRHTTSCGCINRERQKNFGKLIQSSEIQEKIAKTRSENDGIEKGTKLSALSRKKLVSTNKSGHTGVCYLKESGKWRAYLSLKGKRMYLGDYNTKKEAILAREQAENKFFRPILEKYKKG